MINFRFHIVSLIAVFLALAVGIFVGSTVVDQAIVENLDRQIDRVERKADERKAENDRLKSDLERMGAYLEGSAPFAVDGRLAGVPVAVVAESGSGDSVKRTVTLLQQAGADAPVIVWLKPSWRLEDDGDLDALAAVIGDAGDPDDASTLRRRGLVALAERLTEPAVTAGGGGEEAAGEGVGEDSGRRAAGATSSTVETTTTTVPQGADLLEVLDDAGFVSIERIGDGGGDSDGAGGDAGGTTGGTGGESGADTGAEDPATRVLIVGGPASDLFGSEVLIELTRACAGTGAHTAAAEVYVEQDGGPDRGAVVSAIVGDDLLDGMVTTVDDLDLVEGRVSVVIGLDEMADGVVGHYGYGSGASRSLPEWTGR